MRREYKAYKKVGKLQTSISETLEIELSRTVYASPGVINHIKKRHGKQFTKKVKENIIEIVEKIIKDPEYAGTYCKKQRGKAIELVKKVNNVIMLLGLEIDIEDEYIYVATMYPITLSKLNARVYRKRLIKVSDIEIQENIL